ncbi:MAG: sugar phosphorylase [Anaerolineales bacterium]
MHSTHDRLLTHLVALYGDTAAVRVRAQLAERLAAHRAHSPAPPDDGLSEGDSILITYGDQVTALNEPPLRTLADFCDRHIGGVVSGVHLLPFYPWTSDDGFSVVDYRAVDPALGAWDDIRRFGDFRLMFDGVINHISAQSEWFQGFLRDDPRYRDYFIVVEGQPDLSQVVRPRALPLLTRFDTPSGAKAVWTTFSDDQIDLNYANSDLLLEIVDVLLFYAAHGAEFIRLDAIAYLWKQIGTACIHLPQTHHLIQLFRAVMDEAAPQGGVREALRASPAQAELAPAPHVRLITETNVPHRDNVSYFGDGTNEAQLVYNFALPPLTLHTFRTGNARALSEWAAGLSLPSHQVTFFNFLASHDGIGLNPARGILPDGDIDALVQQVLAHGGLVSYKHNPDGTQSPYELNVNYFDALSDPKGADSLETQVDRFMCAQAIMLSLVGVPGIYFHSLFGSRGWPQGVMQTGRNRTINRQKCERATLEHELADAVSLRARVFNRYRELLGARAASPAFHPFGTQEILDGGESVFVVLRRAPEGEAARLCLHNVSATPQVVDVLGYPPVTLKPYEVQWLAAS